MPRACVSADWAAEKEEAREQIARRNTRARHSGMWIFVVGTVVTFHVFVEPWTAIYEDGMFHVNDIHDSQWAANRVNASEV